MATLEDSSRIELDRDMLRYTLASRGGWSIGIDGIRLIGEATNQDGPFVDDYFICFATNRDTWYEASFYAAGREAFLAALSAKLGATIQLSLTSETDFASRILWPVECAGGPMFTYESVPAKTILDRLLGSVEIRQTYSPRALAALQY